LGVVTSGTRTPFLEKSIGLAYLPLEFSAPGTECAIEIRGRRVRAQVVKLPFYTRPRG
jgi:aminomethyltransferase